MPNEEPKSESTPPESIRTTRKPLVLVVEDNEWVQDYVKKIFDKEFRVEIAQDGVVAMEKLEELRQELTR